MHTFIWFSACILALSLSVVQSDITCGEPPSLQFAILRGPAREEYKIGETVSYACDFGYVIDGSDRNIRCLRNAQWTEPKMACIPRSCGDPGYVVNGYRIGAVFTFPNLITFTCDEGYKLQGTAKRYCQASGTWSGRLPKCNVVSCDAPKNPENGRVIFSSLEFGSELKYECDEGFQLSHSEAVFCSSDGTWSRSDIFCDEITCAIPLAPEHGSVSLIGSKDRPRAGTVAVYTCDDGKIPDGPTTSKCLDIGQWTFPAPRCLEPCRAPYIENGNIGRKHYWSGYKEIEAGTELEDGEELFLRCNKDYETMSEGKSESKVICEQGKWSVEPYCKLASCHSDPPRTNNGTAVEVNYQHGGTVLYNCLPDFRKVATGNITCIRGKWKGITPVCKDTRCSLQTIQFPGLENGNKLFYKNGESFQIICNERYTIAKGNSNQMQCIDGSWKGPMPPCVAAGCSSPPPPIDNGRAAISSATHFSFGQYVCDNSYVLSENTKVQCLFGKWTGKPPRCKDGRCYLKDLKYPARLSAETQSVTNSGEHLQVRCIEGYSPQKSVPLCQNGEWLDDNTHPCKESDCVVKIIPHGVITEQTYGEETWKWLKFRYERSIIYEIVPIDTIPSRTAHLVLFCDEGYSFHGTSSTKENIFCIKGRWQPDAVCLRRGTRYYPTSPAPRSTVGTQSHAADRRNNLNRITTESTSAITTLQASTKPTLVHEEEPDMEATTNAPFEESTEEDICSCEYTAEDENLVAYMNGKELKMSDRVQNGSVVKFRCKFVSFYRLEGQKEITCENCRTWHSSDFPRCAHPQYGDAVILYNKGVNVSLDGTLEVNKGHSVRLTCIAMELSEYPTWNVPNENGVTGHDERIERSGDVLYTSYLDIFDPTPENSGFYTCSAGEFPPTVVKLRVIDPGIRCPQFLDENFVISYENENRVGSKATFSCRAYEKKLYGNNILTCLENGEWSDPPPECSDIRCNELKEADMMIIVYSNGQNVGSFAAFHCRSPSVRSGVSRAKCLETGQWSDPTPTCTAPPCFINSLSPVLPKGIVPENHEVNNDALPYGSTVKLICEDADMGLAGNPLAKCGNNGEWQLGKVQCIRGCRPLQVPPESELIVKPRKDEYNFGEIVTLSCPPGKKLNQQLELMMCLKAKWSETDIPECIEATESEDT